MEPKRRNVVVTGGSSGIGLAITRFFAKGGFNVSILDNNTEMGVSVIKILTEEYPLLPPIFYQCDISDWNSLAAAFKDTYQERGNIDIVIANAGIPEQGDFVVTDEQEPQKPNLRTVGVNLKGTIYTLKLAIHYLSKNPASPSRGSLICTSSVAGIYPFPVAPLYASTKHAIIGLVRSLARPLERENIQINALAPSVIQTNLALEKSHSIHQNMILTPMSTLIRAVQMLISDRKLTGQIAEVHGENVTLCFAPRFTDVDIEKNFEMFWSLGYS